MRISASIFHCVVHLSQCLAGSLVFAWKSLVSPLKFVSGFGAAAGGGRRSPFPRCPLTAGCLCRAACSIQLNHLRSHTLSEHGSGVPGARIRLAARPAPGWA